MYGLSDDDLDIQSAGAGLRGRTHPVRGRGGAGRRPAGRRHGGAQEAGHRARPALHQHAEGTGRRRLHHAAAGPRAGADGPGDERARLGRGDPAVLASPGGHAGPGRALPQADDPRRARGVLRDHRGGRRVGRGRDRGDRAPGRRRVGAQRRQVARDLLQHRRLLLLPGQDGRRRAPHVPGGPADPGGERAAHARLLAHDQPPPPDRRLRRRPRPRRQPGRRRGRRHVVRAGVVPFRADDGRGPLRGRGRAPRRRDDRVRDDPWRPAVVRSPSTAWSRECSPTA